MAQGLSMNEPLLGTNIAAAPGTKDGERVGKLTRSVESPVKVEYRDTHRPVSATD